MQTIQNSFSMLVRYAWEQHLHEVQGLLCLPTLVYAVVFVLLCMHA